MLVALRIAEKKVYRTESSVVCIFFSSLRCSKSRKTSNINFKFYPPYALELAGCLCVRIIKEKFLGKEDPLGSSHSKQGKRRSFIVITTCLSN